MDVPEVNIFSFIVIPQWDLWPLSPISGMEWFLSTTPRWCLGGKCWVFAWRKAGEGPQASALSLFLRSFACKNVQSMLKSSFWNGRVAKQINHYPLLQWIEHGSQRHFSEEEFVCIGISHEFPLAISGLSKLIQLRWRPCSSAVSWWSMSLTKHPRRWCWRWRVSCTLEQKGRNLNMLAVNVSNHKEDMERMKTLTRIWYVSWYAWGKHPWISMIWQSGYVRQHLNWNEITLPLRFMLSPEVQEQAWTTRLRPCQGVISETCPASICHCCYIWFSQPWGKTVRSFWWTAGVLSSQPVWDVSPQGIRWFIRTFRLLAVGWGPGGPRTHECNAMPSPPFSSCWRRKPIREHPFMIRIGDKTSDTSWACKGRWCLYLTKDENYWWTHVWIKNCNSLDDIGRVKRVRTTRWSLLRIALAFLSLATTSFGRWVIAACLKCEVNLE